MQRSPARLVAVIVLTAALVLTGAPVAEAAAPAIPDAALLQAEDLNGSVPTPADEFWPDLRPPQPCADDSPYPSAGKRTGDRAVSAMVGFEDRPTVVLNEVATYQGNGARRYLKDLRRALAACGGVDEQGRRWSVLATGVAGDESLLLRSSEYLDFVGLDKDVYLVVARVGRALVMVADLGWEFGDGHVELVRELSVTAARRAAVLG